MCAKENREERLHPWKYRISRAPGPTVNQWEVDDHIYRVAGKERGVKCVRRGCETCRRTKASPTRPSGGGWRYKSTIGRTAQDSEPAARKKIARAGYPIEEGRVARSIWRGEKETRRLCEVPSARLSGRGKVVGGVGGRNDNYHHTHVVVPRCGVANVGGLAANMRICSQPQFHM